ncbi:MAG: cytochrome c oxidase subunit II [Thermoplasmata archaeon]
MVRRRHRTSLMVVLLLAIGLAVQAPARAQGVTPGQVATDQLFVLVFVLALIIGIVVEGLLIAAIILFRRRPGFHLPTRVTTHNPRLELLWTALPVLVIAIVGAGAFQTLQITDTLPQETMTVQVVGMRFAFEFVYPDNTTSTGLLRVQEGQVVRLEVTSQDVIHSYFIPEFRLKIDAVPGRVNLYWFQAMQVGSYTIRCAEYCGVGHFTMVATLEVFPAGSQPIPWGPPA